MDFKLNEQQKTAVLNGNGPVLVVAGAGSGKTRVLTCRVAYLIEEMGVKPYNILAITFTNKAANEMKERIVAMTGAEGLWAFTFHSVCTRILYADIDKIGYDKRFSIYADEDSQRVVKKVFSDMNLDPGGRDEGRYWISYAKERAMSPALFRQSVPGKEIFAEVYRRYEEELKRANALDFDDLLLKTVELLEFCPEVRDKYQERFKHILVDEFQDTNKIQYALVRILADKYKNIFAVGDEDQSIYGWRGANIGNVKELTKDFPDIKVYKLEQNYRSTSNILNCANKLIDNNTERIKKSLWSDRGEGSRVEYKLLYSDREEADFVINSIAGMIRSGCRYSDVAILVRANSLTRLFEEKMNLYGYPYKVFGGFKFYERKEVKDVIAYLRLIANPKDNEAFQRIINFPKRGIGERSVEQLAAYCGANKLSLTDGLLELDKTGISGASFNKFLNFRELLTKLFQASANLPMGKFIDFVLDASLIRTAYNPEDEEDADRLENINELAASIKQFAADNPEAEVSMFLQSVALISDTDDLGNGEYITIATVHSAKGLEFRAVYIVGLEEGIFPSSRSETDKEIEEERRVMYVAATRAKDKLVMTSTKSRFRFNTVQNYLPSRFIAEMGFTPPDTRRNYSDFYGERRPAYTAAPAQVSARPAQEYGGVPQEKRPDKDMKGFKEGAKVRHRRFGDGLIVEMKDNNIAKISFDGLGVREFDLSVAPIDLAGE